MPADALRMALPLAGGVERLAAWPSGGGPHKSTPSSSKHDECERSVDATGDDEPDSYVTARHRIIVAGCRQVDPVSGHGNRTGGRDDGEEKERGSHDL
jgi:hypothetical protein